MQFKAARFQIGHTPRKFPVWTAVVTAARRPPPASSHIKSAVTQGLVYHTNIPFASLFCVISRTFFGIFSLCHILCRPAAAPTKYRPRRGHTIILYRAGWRLLSPAGGVFVKKSVITSGGASLIKGLICTPARRGLTFVRAKVSKTRSRGTGSPLTNPFPVALLRWIRIYF